MRRGYTCEPPQGSFDELLIAQAMALPARLLTADAALARYCDLVWVEPV